MENETYNEVHGGMRRKPKLHQERPIRGGETYGGSVTSPVRCGAKRAISKKCCKKM